jgi:hypothetical protein
MIENGQVFQIDIFAIAEDATNRFTKPEEIEEHYHAKMEIRKLLLSAPLQEGLKEALAGTQCKGETQPVDIKIGIVFWGPNHNRLRGFYYGRKGDGGGVDQRSCELSTPLYDWAHRQLPTDLKLRAE